MNGPGRVTHAAVCTGRGAEGPGGSPSAGLAARAGGGEAVWRSTAIGIRQGIRIPDGMSNILSWRSVRDFRVYGPENRAVNELTLIRDAPRTAGSRSAAARRCRR